MNKKIILATGNMGKVHELQAMLKNSDITIIPQTEFNIPDAEETGLTFVENALIKARQAAKYTRMPAIGDDSGLEIDALNGAPGIYSARYAGEPANFKANIAKVLHEMTDVPNEERTARFQCVLVYLSHANDPTPFICQGTWEGKILKKIQGEKGFGYDPIFYVPTHQCSAAELDPAEKNRISHRAMALKQLLKLLKDVRSSPQK